MKDFLREHLKLWKGAGIPAPENELQSIQNWLRFIGEHGAEETKSAMRKRMLLLMQAAHELSEEGREAEDAAGIYDDMPGMRSSLKQIERSLRHETAIEILKDYLEANGYDGLAYPFTDCGCQLCDLQPCGEDFSQCVPAYEGKAKCGHWEMFVSKDDAEASKK